MLPPAGVATDLIVGLPGAGVESYKQDLQFRLDLRTHARTYRCQVLPNSPMAHPAYVQAHDIQVGEQLFVVSTSSSGPEDLDECHRLFEHYLTFCDLALLRYVLLFMPEEHGLRALDVLQRLMKDLAAHRGGLEQTRIVQRYLNLVVDRGSSRARYSGQAVRAPWGRFYQEIAR